MTDPRTVFAMLLVIGFLLLTAIGMFFQIPESNQDMVNAAMNALGTALGAAVMALLRTDKADDAKTQNTAKAFDAITAASQGPSGTPRSEEHTSELQSLMRSSYAVFCLKKKKTHTILRLKDHQR